MENNKKIIICFMIIVIISGGYYFITSNRNVMQDQQLVKQEKVSQSDIIVKKLADKYQAITGWEENLSYTLQAQDRLITDKPALFKGYVDDIFRQGDKNIIRFFSSFLGPVDYILELECDQRIIEKILAQQSGNQASFNFFNAYAIIANIQEIKKPVFALEGSTLFENEVEINIESSNLFIAKGVCIDIAYIGDDNFFNN